MRPKARLINIVVAVMGTLVWLLVPPTQGFADFVIYKLPGTKLVTIFEGKAKVQAGRILEYTHPTFGAIALSMDDSVIVKAATRQEEFRRLFSKANRSKSVNDFIEAARQAIKRGLMKEFYECCSAAYKVDPSNAVVQRLVEARKRIKQPLGDPSDIEAKLRGETKLPNMKVAVSQHYVLLHDTSDQKSGRRKQTRAEMRLELLEKVYESFFMKFALEGVVLEPPKEHLMVLLFAEEATFHRYSTRLSPELVMASGFWSPIDNIGVFYDQGTTRNMKLMADVAEDLKKRKSQTRGTAISQDVAHLANSFDLLIKVAKEESDIEVVSHEATHQLAGNTGVMPMDKVGARWAHEGLATYFETPAGAGWGGVGAVNQTRLGDYRIIKNDPNRSFIELLISDELFYRAKDQTQIVEAYGQAWALTYFLMETRFAKTIDYYRKCAELEQGATPRKRIAVFNEVFGDPRRLEREFHIFMQSLKTDLERMQEASK